MPLQVPAAGNALGQPGIHYGSLHALNSQRRPLIVEASKGSQGRAGSGFNSQASAKGWRQNVSHDGVEAEGIAAGATVTGRNGVENGLWTRSQLSNSRQSLLDRDALDQVASADVVHARENGARRLEKMVTRKFRTPRITRDDISRNVVAVILAGGTTNTALTQYRAMPALELGSNTQLIDVPISNCMRSNIYRTFVLTQFNSHTLNQHIASAYPPVTFGGPHKQGFVEVLACSQTPTSTSWYRGSADAVRRNLQEICESYRGLPPPEEVLILSGQGLYRMDYADLIRTHRDSGADITIATSSVGWDEAARRGLVRVDADTGAVKSFVEKPTGPSLDAMVNGDRANGTHEQPFEASMGIYVFNREVLTSLLHENENHFGGKVGLDTHFGHDVIPHALRNGLNVQAHHHEGFWKDVSSLRDFFQVNLSLALPGAPITVYDANETIVKRGQMLPPAMVHNCELENVLLGEGSTLRSSTFKRVVVGLNTFVAPNCTIEDSLLMGCSIYQNDASRAAARAASQPVFGIGEGTTIKGAIIDADASIGSNVTITNRSGIKEANRAEEDGIIIEDGIVVVLKNANIPDNFVV